MRTTCAHSVRGPLPRQPDTEEFCNVIAPLTSVVVTFNGIRYEVFLCDEHKARHDDAAAQKRIARRNANAAARQSHEQRHHRQPVL